MVLPQRQEMSGSEAYHQGKAIEGENPNVFLSMDSNAAGKHRSDLGGILSGLCGFLLLKI